MHQHALTAEKPLMLQHALTAESGSCFIKLLLVHNVGNAYDGQLRTTIVAVPSDESTGRFIKGEPTSQRTDSHLVLWQSDISAAGLC